MSDFPDFTHLREARAGKAIAIPLNGTTYHAIPDPPADLVLEAVAGESAVDPDMARRWEADPTSLTNAEAIAVAAAGRQERRKRMRFLDAVLEPDSAERWARNMAPLPDDPKPTPAQRKKWQAEHITFEQAQAVYQHLLSMYSGGRPTEAPSSSNGHGASGATSTAGAPSGE